MKIGLSLNNIYNMSASLPRDCDPRTQNLKMLTPNKSKQNKYQHNNFAIFML